MRVAVHAREAVRALAEDLAVVGALHHQARDLDRVQDVLDRRDRAGVVRAPVHARGVELHDAVLVRQAAQTDAGVLRVRLLHLHHGDRGVERRSAREQGRKGRLHAGKSVLAADHQRTARFLVLLRGPGDRRQRRRGAGSGGQTDQLAARERDGIH